jgi:hypothetical protein
MLIAHALRYDGEGRRNDLAGLALQGEDAQQAVELDVRHRWTRWQAGITGGATNREYVRRDFVAELAATTKAQTPFVSTELARHFGQSAVALGASWAARVPTGSVPTVDRGPNYRRLQAPELAYEVAEASAVALSLTWQRQVGRRALLAQFRREEASPRSVVASRLQPEGARERWVGSLTFR